MLTICRQGRAPKGARKPVVGPVACYRGVGRTLPNLHLWRLRGGHERRTAENPVRLALPGAVGRDEGCFRRSVRAGGGTDGYEIYIKSAQRRPR
ncbi:hypothetical protein DF050_31495 [Burkholderia cepacia]|nr:hypothetical protein [Burkholderia sp. HAN2018]RQT44677.1 hypothetical protein DF050_31495 [Burkholderia cepacia]RQT82462.1 hypothetical protein DF041_35245 [Burkholderia cepacia]